MSQNYFHGSWKVERFKCELKIEFCHFNSTKVSTLHCTLLSSSPFFIQSELLLLFQQRIQRSRITCVSIIKSLFYLLQIIICHLTKDKTISWHFSFLVQQLLSNLCFCFDPVSSLQCCMTPDLDTGAHPMSRVTWMLSHDSRVSSSQHECLNLVACLQTLPNLYSELED